MLTRYSTSIRTVLCAYRTHALGSEADQRGVVAQDAIAARREQRLKISHARLLVNVVHTYIPSPGFGGSVQRTSRMSLIAPLAGSLRVFADGYSSDLSMRRPR